MPTTIRPGHNIDLPDVQRLNNALFKYEHAAGYYLDDSFNLEWSYANPGIRYFTERLSGKAGNAVFLAIMSGETIGYLAGSYQVLSYRSVNPVAEIENMFVDENVRRQGVGKQLLDAFLKWCAENSVSRIRVDAFTPNMQALKFYQKCGFVNAEVVLEKGLN